MLNLKMVLKMIGFIRYLKKSMIELSKLLSASVFNGFLEAYKKLFISKWSLLISLLLSIEAKIDYLIEVTK